MAAALLLVAFGCSTDGANTVSIGAGSQFGDGTYIEVDSAEIGRPGFVVVRRDLDGTPGEVVGHLALPVGELDEFIVPLDVTIDSGTYWVALHVDDGETGTFEFVDRPELDGPLVVGGSSVMVSVELMVDQVRRARPR